MQPRPTSVTPARVAVIGAGPAGLAAAARLAEAGISVDLFEASAAVGGLARSLSLWDCELELSAHIFRSTDPFVSRLWHESAGELVEISLRRGIFDGNGVTHYPITPLRILRSLGLLVSVQSAVGLVAGRLTALGKPAPENAEAWMVRTYGRQLHERFLCSYAEKLWGVPCHQIDARFPQFLFQSAGSSQEGRQSFFYPRAGNSAVWNNLSDRLTAQGVRIHRETRVNRFITDNNRVTGLVANDTQFDVDHVISTMPLGLLARLALPNEPAVAAAASTLKSRSTLLVYLMAPAGKHSDFNWLSVYPDTYRVGRITDFGRWLNRDDGNTVYCLEYWCDAGDELWQTDDRALAELACNELNRTQLVGQVTALKSHVERVPGSHPVFSLGFQSSIDCIQQHLATLSGISSVGRSGAHGVLGMGESMESARDAADQVIGRIGQLGANRATGLTNRVSAD